MRINLLAYLGFLRSRDALRKLRHPIRERAALNRWATLKTTPEKPKPVDDECFYR